MKKILILVFCLLNSSVYANWPERPVSIVTQASAGNSMDIECRVLAEELGKRFKNKFLVINAPGALGSIATKRVMNAPSDGYTLLFSAEVMMAAKLTIKDANYDLTKDIIPISITNEIPMILVASKKYKTINDIIKTGKERELLIGIIGSGGLTHLLAHIIAKGEKLNHRFIPFTKAQDLIINIMNDTTDFTIVPVSLAKSLNSSDNVNIIGVIGNKRSPIIPDVPALSEANINIYIEKWSGLFASGNTPKNIVDELVVAINDIKNSKDFREKMINLGIYISYNMNNKQMINFLQKEEQFYITLFNELNILTK